MDVAGGVGRRRLDAALGVGVAGVGVRRRRPGRQQLLDQPPSFIRIHPSKSCINSPRLTKPLTSIRPQRIPAPSGLDHRRRVALVGIRHHSTPSPATRRDDDFGVSFAIIPVVGNSRLLTIDLRLHLVFHLDRLGFRPIIVVAQRLGESFEPRLPSDPRRPLLPCRALFVEPALVNSSHREGWRFWGFLGHHVCGRMKMEREVLAVVDYER